MPKSILKINIANELDVVLAYKRAKQLSEKLGLTIGNQTKFATAVSEICRNVVEHVGTGSIAFSIIEDGGTKFIEAIVSDRGRGIGNIDFLLSRPIGPNTTKGTGLINTRKLVDFFNIESEFEKGTRVTLRQRVPHNTPAVTKAVAEAWMYEFDTDSVSPYAEIKRQNMQLLEVMDQLRERTEEAEQQLEEISRLNIILQQTNKDIQELLLEREKQNKKLQEINEELDTFAHTVSHDLRAPLQNINGLSRALEESISNNKLVDAKELFPMLYQQTSRMDQFIMGILSYSLAGRSDTPKQHVDLNELLKGVINLLNVPDYIIITYPSETLLLTTETILLYQVLSNLIANAIKYHDLTEHATISIGFEQDNSWIRFVVEDNGPGIPAEVQNNIFDMYQTGNSMDSGTGLGLSIVKKIVTSKGGRVWVESEKRGSHFYFTWPASEVSAAKV